MLVHSPHGHSQRFLRIVTALCLTIAGAHFASNSSAQGIPLSVPYDVTPIGSSFSTGCLEPSPCDCLAMEVGVASGLFRLQALLPPLGPIFEYQVLDVDMYYVLAPNTFVFMVGSGNLTVDVVSGTLQMSLELSFDGAPPVLFETNGTIPTNSNFPEEFDFDLFHQIDSCLFDGIRIRAFARGRFIRGDVNEDGQLDLGDAINAIQVILPHVGIPTIPGCMQAVDANGDSLLNIADPIYLLIWLFQEGPPPGHPFPDCGTVLPPLEQNLGCEGSPSCV